MKFSADAGRRLAGKLAHLKDRQPVVLALPRGGVAVGFEIAQALNAPLDIVLVRKIGVPWQPELALGAVTAPFLRRARQVQFEKSRKRILIRDMHWDFETARAGVEIGDCSADYSITIRLSICDGGISRPALGVFEEAARTWDSLLRQWGFREARFVDASG